MFNLEMLNKSSIATQPERVRQMFGSIARRYDLANHHAELRRRFLLAESRCANRRRLDSQNRLSILPAGTGDLSLAIQKKLPDAEIIAVDFLPEMLELAKGKGVRPNRCGRCDETCPLPIPPLIA